MFWIVSVKIYCDYTFFLHFIFYHQVSLTGWMQITITQKTTVWLTMCSLSLWDEQQLLGKYIKVPEKERRLFGQWSDTKWSWYGDHQGGDVTSVYILVQVWGTDITPNHSRTRDQCSQDVRSGRGTNIQYRSQWTENSKLWSEFRHEKTEKHVLNLILLRKMTNKRGQSDRICLWMLYKR